MAHGRPLPYAAKVSVRMNPLPKFLVVDDVSENRYLIAKVLLQKFSGCLLQECEESAPALVAAQSDRLTAAVVHRASDVDGLTLIALLRRVNPSVPIIMVSGRESCPGAIEAGANAFLNYESWLRVGTVVEEAITAERLAAPPARFPFSDRQPAEPIPPMGGA
jgi:CheY-like chemotaxis protein